MIKRKYGKRGKREKKTKKRANSRLWTLKKADTEFSRQIRARDGRCLHPRCICGNKMLQCSHYFERAIKSTRFDPENNITLGWLCHYKNKRIGFEYQKQTVKEDGFDGKYTIFMKKHLGPEKFEKLCKRAKTSIKQNEAIRKYQLSVRASLVE